MQLDSHQHFWHYSAAEYPWIPAGSPLARDWLPEDLAQLQKPLGLDGSIAVQARQSVAESEWLLKLADADPRIKGVVGWVDLRALNVADDLERLSKHPKFVGVRHVVQDEPDDWFLMGHEFLRGVSQVRSFGLTYDILIYPKQLPAAIKFAESLPDQPLVLDHIAKPLIKDGVIDPWREQIKELARFPHVMCKVSGMVTEADHKAWKPDDFRRYLDVVFEAFGPERLMWGSDWPVCLLAASYEKVLTLVRDYAAGLTPSQQSALFGENCARFYLKTS